MGFRQHIVWFLYIYFLLHQLDDCNHKNYLYLRYLLRLCWLILFVDNIVVDLNHMYMYIFDVHYYVLLYFVVFCYILWLRIMMHPWWILLPCGIAFTISYMAGQTNVRTVTPSYCFCLFVFTFVTLIFYFVLFLFSLLFFDIGRAIYWWYW